MLAATTSPHHAAGGPRCLTVARPEPSAASTVSGAVAPCLSHRPHYSAYGCGDVPVGPVGWSAVLLLQCQHHQARLPKALANVTGQTVPPALLQAAYNKDMLPTAAAVDQGSN